MTAPWPTHRSRRLNSAARRARRRRSIRAVAEPDRRWDDAEVLHEYASELVRDGLASPLIVGPKPSTRRQQP